jgi:hypothetical protein
MKMTEEDHEMIRRCVHSKYRDAASAARAEGVVAWLQFWAPACVSARVISLAGPQQRVCQSRPQSRRRVRPPRSRSFRTRRCPRGAVAAVCEKPEGPDTDRLVRKEDVASPAAPWKHNAGSVHLIHMRNRVRFGRSLGCRAAVDGHPSPSPTFLKTLPIRFLPAREFTVVLQFMPARQQRRPGRNYRNLKLSPNVLF